MKSFAKLIGRLPLAGKLTLRPLLFALYQSTTKKARRSNYLKTQAVLIVFVLLHWYQMRLGIEALAFSAPLAAKTVYACYALVNACVLLTQAYLVYRTTRFYLFGARSRIIRRYRDLSFEKVMTMLTVTMAGQTIFFVLYDLFK